MKSSMAHKPRLFTYTIPFDDGSAPNPFNGMCSLAICKPGIRRTAQPGDWVAGIGSKNAPSGNLGDRLVYAMRVDEVLSMSDYDHFALSRWPHRIPNMRSMALQDRLGDCVYDFSSGAAVQRPGVHGPGNIETDLGGKNVLISYHFYYFGHIAVPLPTNLLGIRHPNQGHRSNSNESYFPLFLKWIKSLAYMPGQHGFPDYIDTESTRTSGCTSFSLCSVGKWREIDDKNDPDC